jgi:hypothetical protein
MDKESKDSSMCRSAPKRMKMATGRTGAPGTAFDCTLGIAIGIGIGF